MVPRGEAARPWRQMPGDGRWAAGTAGRGDGGRVPRGRGLRAEETTDTAVWLQAE